MSFEDFKPPPLLGSLNNIPEAKPTEPPLPIFNASHMPPMSEGMFQPFARLPKEIRLQIWQRFLERQRIISVTLEECTDKHREPISHSSIPETRPRPSNGKQYQATVTSRQFLSVLFRVSHEARTAALHFYRVHIPCRCESGATQMETTLYFNPEHDFLKITSKRPTKKTLVGFLRDLKFHDPRNVGLLNLAMDLNDLNANDLHELQPGDLTASELEAFVATMSQLREVFFVCIAGTGRIISGPLNGLLGSDASLFEFQRSYPIATRTAFFQRLQRDPRNIDLQRVFSGTSDPRNMVFTWQRLLQSWNISHANSVSYKFMLTHAPLGKYESCTNLQVAEGWIRREHQMWLDVQNQNRGYIKKTKGRFPLEDSEDLQRAVKPAFGFWLFPLDALGQIPKDVAGTSIFRPKRMLDVREHWPELVLMDLY